MRRTLGSELGEVQGSGNRIAGKTHYLLNLLLLCLFSVALLIILKCLEFIQCNTIFAKGYYTSKEGYMLFPAIEVFFFFLNHSPS